MHLVRSSVLNELLSSAGEMTPIIISIVGVNKLRLRFEKAYFQYMYALNPAFVVWHAQTVNQFNFCFMNEGRCKSEQVRIRNYGEIYGDRIHEISICGQSQV